jgi:hypothetical protein
MLQVTRSKQDLFTETVQVHFRTVCHNTVVYRPTLLSQVGSHGLTVKIFSCFRATEVMQVYVRNMCA